MFILLKKLISITLFCFLVGCNTNKSVDVVECWETRNSKFKIQVTSIRDDDIFPFLAGASYFFKSISLETGERKEFMILHHDNVIPINKSNIKFVNENVAYVFMEWKYAVTTDGGKTWNIWDGSKKILRQNDLKYGLIQEVKLSENGIGMMILRPDLKQRFLSTNNFGMTWTVNQ